MLKGFLSAIFILILLNAGAQNFDSLLAVSGTLKHDTDKINLFYKEGFSNRATDPQYSYFCAKQAEQIAQRVSLPYFISKVSNLLGILYYRKHDLATALSYHKKALNLRTIINDQRGIALSNINLGNIYTDLKKFDLAEQAYLQSLNICHTLGDQKQVGNCLLNLGVLNTGQKNINAAKNYFTTAIKNARSRHDYELEAICLNNLAVINISANNFDDAIGNCVNSIKIKDLMENEMEMADSYLNIALAYYKKNDKQLAEENLKIADSIIAKYDYTAALIQSLKIKADRYNEEKNYELAFNYLNRYHELQDSLRIINDALNLENNFIETYNKPTIAGTENFKFPFIYMNALLLILILTGAFLFNMKR